MKILNIVQGNAIAAFNAADANGKKLLTDLFGAAVLNAKITDCIKTFEDALEHFGLAAKDVLPYTNPQTNDEKALQALAKLRIINRALCNGWEADYSDGNQTKYRPWFEYDGSSSAFRFNFSSYDCSDADAGSSVRLVLPTRELSDYFGTQFLDLHNQYLTLQ